MDKQGSAVSWRRWIGALLIGGTVLMAAGHSSASAATSAFESLPNDPRAVTVKGKGDGRADDTDAIQHAVDQAAEHGGGGVVFLPSGRYRISRTILIWPAVRVFSIGPTRPVLLLG